MPRVAAFSLATLAIFASLPAQAAGVRVVHCFLKVDGKVYLDQPCRFEAEVDGSFSIGTAATDADKREPFFAIMNTTGGGNGEAFWNEDASLTHAQTALGVVKRRGPCWRNARAEICAR